MKKPDARGYFGEFGGRFVPEVLIAALDQLERAIESAFADPSFWNEYNAVLRDFVGRPSPLYRCDRYVAGISAAPLLMKREDTNHTGAHKINNTVGQALLALRMGKRRLLAETGAGQHGVATATVGAKFGLPVDVYMGARDVERQALNVHVMRLLGATVHPVESGTQTLKDATNEAFRVWAERVDDTFYVIGSVVGAHPYPYLVREFQKVVGVEARHQVMERYGRLPSDVVACVGGGSNAIGIFAGFVDDPDVKLWGVEAGGEGIESGKTAASLGAGTVGILHGSRSYLLQSDEGQVSETYSTAAGLDYPGVGPEHAFLMESGRATYVNVTDAEAIDAFGEFARSEGIVPALESAHAIAFARKLSRATRCRGSYFSQFERPRRQRSRAMSAMLARMFERAKRERRVAFIPYVMAGDPNLATTEAILDALSAAGADAIEVGIPYSDPLADGPTIASAGARALSNGTSVSDVFALVRRCARGSPLLLFTYFNPVYQFGVTRFAQEAATGRRRRCDRSRLRARGIGRAAQRAGELAVWRCRCSSLLRRRRNARNASPKPPRASFTSSRALA